MLNQGGGGGHLPRLGKAKPVCAKVDPMAVLSFTFFLIIILKIMPRDGD